MVGMDINPGKLRFLRGTNPFLVRGTAFHLPFRAGVFSLIVNSEVIEHIAKSDSLFLEMNRVLAPGGTLVLGTPDYESKIRRFGEYCYHALLPNACADDHISQYTLAELKALLPEFGFELVNHRYVWGAELIVKARKTRSVGAAGDSTS